MWGEGCNHTCGGADTIFCWRVRQNRENKKDFFNNRPALEGQWNPNDGGFLWPEMRNHIPFCGGSPHSVHRAANLSV